MGIRIHKVLGYGLIDIFYEELADDPRFDPKGFFADDRNRDSFSMKQFYVELELITRDRKAAIDLFLLKKEIKEGTFNHFRSIMAYDGEFGMKSVCVFIPPSEIDNWHRYNDIIDYTEALNNTNELNFVQKLSKPIYPYDSYMDIRTLPPQPVNGDMRALRTLVDDPDLNNWITDDKMMEMYNFKSVKEFKNKVVPNIPTELIETLRFLKVFRDPNTVYSLRPMIYTYWS